MTSTSNRPPEPHQPLPTCNGPLDVWMIGDAARLHGIGQTLESLGHRVQYCERLPDADAATALAVIEQEHLPALRAQLDQIGLRYLLVTTISTDAPVNHIGPQATSREVYLALQLVLEDSERQHRLMQSEQQLEAIFANSQVGIMLLTGYRRLARANDRMAEILGYDSPQQMLGISMREIHLSEQNFVDFGEQFYNNLRKGKILHIEYPLRRRDGSAVWCMANGKALDNSNPPDLNKGVLWVIDDISHIKETEQELREQHELFSSGPVVVFRWLPDENWSVDSCSSNVLNVLGYAAADLVDGKLPFAELLHADDLARVAGEVADYLARGVDSFEQEYRLKHADGHYLEFFDHTQIQRNEAGEVWRIYGYLLDVTQRNSDEARMREMDIRRKALLDISLDGIVILDQQHAIVEANRRASEMLGYPHQEFLKLHIWDWEADMSKQEIMRRFPDPSLIESRFESRHLCKDGRIIDVEISAAGKEINGEPMVITLVRDITERKRAERALAEAETRFSSAIASSIDGFWQVSMDGHLQYVNEAYCRYSGYARDELIGMAVSELDVEDDPHSVRQRIGGVLESGSMLFETRHRRKDGSTWHVEVSSSYNPGQADMLFVFLRNIDGRKQAERERLRMESELQQTRKMEALGQLTGGVAHEFNNMLAIMTGHLTLLKKTLSSDADDKVKTYIDSIETAGKRARSMIQQMLAFSRPGESSTQQIAIKPAVNEALALARSGMPSSVVIEFEAQSGLPDVMLDTVELQQIVTNLLINARDAMAGKGRIDVRLKRHDNGAEIRRCVYCHSPIEGEWIELSVTDTGHGISQDDLSRVFEPFYSTKAVGKGTGLGLSVLQGIVGRAGGHILVDSEPGQGTCFCLLFPPAGERREDITQLQMEDPRRRANHARCRLLVVDDEELLTYYFEELLADEGHQVSTCNDPLKALDMLAEKAANFDVLITDQTMPGLLGTELAQQARRINPRLKIILCTGDSGLVSGGSTQYDFLDHIQAKPVDPDELFAVIDELMDD
jgi:PAS domain S-box-containing protein